MSPHPLEHLKNTQSLAPLPGLAASAASRLPRWAIVWLIALYILQGLVQRDAWRGEDVMHVALARSVMESVLEGNFSALAMPSLAMIPQVAAGPLWTLITVVFISPLYVVSWWNQTPVALHLLDDLARIPLAIAMALGFLAIWKSADRFARRREAQPLDPLGVGPRSADFGKTLGDCALLMTAACLGVIYPWHQAGPQAAVFLLASLALWSLATAPETPKRSALQLSLLLTAMFLTQGIGIFAAWFLIIVMVFGLVKSYQLVARVFFGAFLIRTVGLVGLSALLIWSVAPAELFGAWWASQTQGGLIQKISASGLAGANSIGRWFMDVLWKWWPLWPIAILGLWKARKVHFARAPQWAVPTIAVTVISLVGLMGPPDWRLAQLAGIAPLALIAAFGLLSMPRPLVNLIDWFAVALFTALGLFIWLYWTALNFGFPQTLARRVPLLAPGISGTASIHEIIIGFGATLAWIVLVLWRIRRGTARLWRPMVLSAGGLTLVWTLLITLWVPAIDRILGQRVVASSLERAWMASARQHFGAAMTDNLRRLPKTACVSAAPDAMGFNAMAIAYTHLPIRNDPSCRWRLSLVAPQATDAPKVPQTSAKRTAAKKGAVKKESVKPATQWTVIWQSRATEDRRNRERYLLLERTP